jgi:hypothetical protein
VIRERAFDLFPERKASHVITIANCLVLGVS